VTHLLKKRGAEILSTTTSTVFVTSTVTTAETDGTQVVTNTATVFSCQPTTVATTIATTEAGTTIVSVVEGSLSTTTPSAISTQTGPGGADTGAGDAGGSVVTVYTAASPAPTHASGAVYSFQGRTVMMGWVFLFWIVIIVATIIAS